MKSIVVLCLFWLSISGLELQAHRLYKKPTEFKVGPHNAFILRADKPAKGNPWVWYAPTLPRHPDQSHTWYIKKLLAKGISLAGLDQGEVRGSNKSNQNFTAFYHEMVKRGYSSKPVLLGQSRGGLMMLSWATLHPEKTKALGGIYPVCNLLSWPLKKNRRITLNDYQMTIKELRTNLKKLNPINRLEAMAKNKVPMFMVHGDSDHLVPIEINSAIVEQRYRKLGGPIEIELIKGKGHQVDDTFFKSQKLIEFLIDQSLK